jgi:YesN/AraC family two-component response regulator
LQKLFREKTGGGVIEYFNRMKIETAKQMIREGKYNFTQLSEYLGYSSVCYFSRMFKKATGMSPSEYSSSIKIRTLRPYQDSK